MVHAITLFYMRTNMTGFENALQHLLCFMRTLRSSFLNGLLHLWN
jgi:hypothetical protein